ncbi:unnamed protein product [Sphagnum jensenii]|uniref:Uncharacterized protein n=2 Tax=Sphagnum jensenii TaxID=128206 RepID=A0ABP0W4T9_9BRYO
MAMAMAATAAMASSSSASLCPCSSLVQRSLPACVNAAANSTPKLSTQFLGSGTAHLGIAVGSSGAARLEGAAARGKKFVVRAFELDQDSLLAISVGVAGLALGIGIPIFYETQLKAAETRGNDQPCFPCRGTGSQTCRFCYGAGNITVELGAGEKEVSKCINCEGSGSLTCTTCQGTGIQPRYLDRREYKDDD